MATFYQEEYVISCLLVVSSEKVKMKILTKVIDRGVYQSLCGGHGGV